MSQLQRAAVNWRDGVPVSTQFDDPYYSLSNGLDEARHVFLAGNDLPGRFTDGFHVAELGFGTGLNLLATVEAWNNAGCNGTLVYTGFEAFPLSAESLERALDRFSDVAQDTADLVTYWSAGAVAGTLRGSVQFEIIVGDARRTLPAWNGAADAWFLDGFAPAKNPELWELDLLEEVAAHTAPNGTFATYTAAGHVRRGLQDAGFDVERRSGFGRKRHMSAGRLR